MEMVLPMTLAVVFTVLLFVAAVLAKIVIGLMRRMEEGRTLMERDALDLIGLIVSSLLGLGGIAAVVLGALRNSSDAMLVGGIATVVGLIGVGVWRKLDDTTH